MIYNLQKNSQAKILFIILFIMEVQKIYIFKVKYTYVYQIYIRIHTLRYMIQKILYRIILNIVALQYYTSSKASLR